jgi:glycosyl transferase, family 25
MNAKPGIPVINLEHRTDRRLGMQNKLLRIGRPAEFFSATRPESAADFPSIGARGCLFESPRGSEEGASLDPGAQQGIILEDDVNFDLDFAQQWRVATSAPLMRE